MTEQNTNKPTPKEEIHRGGRHNIWTDKGNGFRFTSEDLTRAIEKQRGEQTVFAPIARQQRSEGQR